MRGIVAAVLFAAGCGRIGFGSTSDGRPGGDSEHRDTAAPSCGADGTCNPLCGAADPDCHSVCGDGTCSGNSGETCESCPSDCKTRMAVCGNSVCDPGEDGTTCATDCGAIPWTWAADETDLLSALSNARTSGVACPGMSLVTAPVLALDSGLQRAARDLAWEEAQFGDVGNTRCDGQTIVSFMTMVNANGVHLGDGATTINDRVNNWTSDMAACPQLMTASYTVAGIGIAVAANSSFVVLLR